MGLSTCGNLPNYIGSPIKEQLEAKFHRPVTVANDANCMCLGEVWVGGAKGYTDVIGVTLGTGVGGGILTGGRLLEGARGLGGVPSGSTKRPLLSSPVTTNTPFSGFRNRRAPRAPNPSTTPQTAATAAIRRHDAARRAMRPFLGAAADEAAGIDCISRSNDCS